MEKQQYLMTLNKWKEEKNLARLVYRIIKFEEIELSYQQICNRAKSFRFTKKEISEMKLSEEKEKQEFRNKKTKELELKGYTDIEWKDNNVSFNNNGKRFFSTYTKELSEIEMKYLKVIFTEGIEEAIKIVLNAKYIKQVKVASRYASGEIIEGSFITKYKAIK